MSKTVFLVYVVGINTLTSVAKDNMILEIMEDDDNEQTV